jgi:hypothetical protein
MGAGDRIGHTSLSKGGNYLGQNILPPKTPNDLYGFS